LSIAETALADGALVFLGGRSSQRLEAALKQLASVASASGGKVAGAVLDMSSAESIDNWVPKAKRRWRALGLLVNAEALRGQLPILCRRCGLVCRSSNLPSCPPSGLSERSFPPLKPRRLDSRHHLQLGQGTLARTHSLRRDALGVSSC
jgi:hypothetical protein